MMKFVVFACLLCIASTHASLSTITDEDGSVAVDSGSYPVYGNLGEMLSKWNADNSDYRPEPSTNPAGQIKIFDYNVENDRTLANQYREAGVPFVLRHFPGQAQDLWTNEYITEQFAGRHLRADVSPNNHFMWFARNDALTKSHAFKAPTTTKHLTFSEWFDIAQGNASPHQNDQAHYYLQMSTRDPVNDWFRTAYPDLATTPLLGSMENDTTKHLDCRFSQQGIVAEPHFDVGGNYVMMVRGQRRIVLTPPSSCSKLNIDPLGPMARHSLSNWADESTIAQFQQDQVKALEVVLEGESADALYIPPYWFHYIMSLSTSIQCNYRPFYHTHIAYGQIEKCMSVNAEEYDSFQKTHAVHLKGIDKFQTKVDAKLLNVVNKRFHPSQFDSNGNKLCSYDDQYNDYAQDDQYICNGAPEVDVNDVPPSISGDPQFVGLQGQSYQVHGVPDEFFNLVSTPSFQMNGHFAFISSGNCDYNDTACFSHPGTYVDIVTIMISNTTRILAKAGEHKVGMVVTIETRGQRPVTLPLNTSVTLLDDPVLGQVTVHALSTHRLVFQTNDWRIVMINSDIFFNFEIGFLNRQALNAGAKHIVQGLKNDNIVHSAYPAQFDQSIHGLIGQTWKNVEYSTHRPYEGEAVDYLVCSRFACDSVYNVFQGWCDMPAAKKAGVDNNDF